MGVPSCRASLNFVFVAAAARATVTAIATITTVAAIVVATALVALPAAHHRARTLLMLIDLDGHVADHVLVDLGLALQLGDHRGRRVEIERDIMGLAVLLDAIGDVAE